MKIAVEGCCHGMLDSIYASLPNDVELLIICGDFQALRNKTDLKTIAVPEKYKQMGDFPSYYSGAKLAPVLTIFIGGNHECSSYMKELKYGGWVAHNIYYLGEFGSVYYRGLRIAGISGIYNNRTFNESMIHEDEKLPFNPSTLRSVYQMKLKSYMKALLLQQDSSGLDIFITHDWPRNVEKHGNLSSLLRRKQHFREDIKNGRLGNPLSEILFERLHPRYWFSGHLHVSFEAVVNVKSKGSRNWDQVRTTKKRKMEEIIMKSKKSLINDETESKPQNSEQLCISMDDEDIDTTSHSQQSPKDPHNVAKNETQLEMDSGKSNNIIRNENEEEKDYTVHFIALDKCLPRRKFLKIIEIEPMKKQVSCDADLHYDRRAIAINKVIEKSYHKISEYYDSIHPNEFVCFTDRAIKILDDYYQLIFQELKTLDDVADEMFRIDQSSFVMVAPSVEHNNVPLKYWENNQTIEYCKKFNIESEASK